MNIRYQDLSLTLKKTKNILISPHQYWLELANIEEQKKDLYIHYALPLIGMCSLFVFVGTLVNFQNITHAFTQMISTFISLTAGIYLSTLIIKLMAPSFQASSNENRNFMLVIYSTSIFCIFHSIANTFSYFSFYRQLFILFELYFVRLLWLGATPILHIPEKKKAGFTLISGLIILSIPMILEKLLSYILQIPIISI